MLTFSPGVELEITVMFLVCPGENTWQLSRLVLLKLLLKTHLKVRDDRHNLFYECTLCEAQTMKAWDQVPKMMHEAKTKDLFIYLFF